MDPSPTSSPPLPPAPLQAKNRGSAAPHHFQTELASPEVTAAAAAASKSSPQTANGSGRFTPTRAGSNSGASSAAAAGQRRVKTQTPQAPPALANGNDVIHSTSLQKRFSLSRLIARGFLLFLAYTFFFVCPSLPDTKTNLICDSVATVKDWLHPYAEPVVVKVSETYKTYAEPYVDQYGRPLYDQGQKYYVDVAQPAIKTASVKAKGAYHQYAHPHVNKAYETVYTPEIKAHVNRAQTAFNGYQKQAQEQLIYIRKLSQDANDNVWRIHAAHVQPVVDKVTPHAKVAWDHASISAARAYDAASDLYLKHVNPYAQQSYTIILDAADNVRESLAFHTDEIWGTKLSKRHKKSKAARAADRAADKAQQAKAAIEKAARDAAKKFKHEPEPETLKDTLLKKAADAQRIAEEYAEGAKEAIHDTVIGAQKAADKAAKDTKDAKAAAAEKAYGAQKKAEEFIENVRDAAARKAQDAQKAASDEAQFLRKTADEGSHEAGKLSERIKKTVIEKAHEAQEAVARQAENLRHVAQEQVEHVQEAGAHLRDRVVGATHDTKEAIDKEAEYVADVASKKKKHVEKLAKEQAAAAKLAAQQKEKEAREWADQAAQKVQDTYEAAADGASDIKGKVLRTAHDADHAIRKQAEEATHQAQKVFEYAEEQTEEAKSKAAKAAKKARKDARKQAKELKRAAEQAAHDGQGYLDVPAEAAANAKEYVVQHVKDASDQAAEAKEATKQKVLNAHTASKASLAAMIAGIEASFGHFYDYEDSETKTLWSKLQSAIDEHVEGAKKSAQNLEKANREAYESFESYVRDWRNQGGGDLEDRLSKLKQQSVESVKSIGQRAEADQTAAKSKVKVLANNVDVYLNGLKDFLADRLEASKETIASELSVFKDTSSKDDEETVRGKLAQLEAAARTRLDSAGKDAHAKAQQLLKQVDEIWSKSETQSRELAEKTQELAKKASEDAKLTVQHVVGNNDKKGKGKKEMVEEVEDTEAPGSLKSKIQSVKDAAANRAHEASGKLDEMINDKSEGGSTGDAEASNVRVAVEEPGSGHRHHRH
ncbi:hypothetical protein BGZ95_011176 [Linnemannia exigua]|uniref:Uncharacterized protein n=1 Tax=Linnemannia exigua TaxID=604196 RepID=A0AAD4DAA8_9FUNG|nr:hypothetical protein BGZ95_011176 [Linnemannia exigua]